MCLKLKRERCPAVTSWCKGFNIGEAYIDGGAQISVMTQACMEKLGLKVDGSSDFKLRLANHAKVKCLGRCMNVPVTIYGVTCNVNCHIMLAGFTYPGKTLVKTGGCHPELEGMNHNCTQQKR